MKSILEYLESFNENKIVPMHMPGHKRNINKEYLKELRADLDITEISGADDLHNPTGIIKESLERARKLYGVKDLFYLINGSTSGNLSGIKSLTKRGDHVLVARNSHKSIYNSIELLGLNPTFLYPDFVEGENFLGSIDPLEVKMKLDENKKIKLVIITSPTYEGVISDIKSISEICHERGVKLFVDEAHGAHFGMGYAFQKSATDLGADMCVKSLHKTLSAHTSTSILLNNCEDLSREDIQRQINIFETTSPSYLLIASIDSLILDLIENGKNSFNDWKDMCNEFKEELKDLKYLTCIDFGEDKYKNVFDYDITRFVISTKDTNISGIKLSSMLLDRNIELEMSSLKYAIAMTGMGETRENLRLFKDALYDIDKNIKEEKSNNNFDRMIYEDFKRALPVWKACDSNKEFVKIEDSIGRIIGENIWAYPPGIPLITPGEVISESFVEQIRRLKDKNININSDYKGVPFKFMVLKDS